MHTVLRYDEKPHLLTRCLFATGRSCILHLLRKYDPGVVFVPELHPAGVADPIDSLKLPRVSYRVRDDFEVDLEDLAQKMEAHRRDRPLVILIHFFGYWMQSWGAAALAHKYDGILLEDCAHCLPTEDASICGDVRLYSYNKMFPVIDGAIMFSCTPRVDLTYSGEKEPLQGEAVEAYSRHLSANRIIADMPTPSSDLEWGLFREVRQVSERAYRDYYQVVSADMEPRLPVSLEWLGQYDHDDEKMRRHSNADWLLGRIDCRSDIQRHLFRKGYPTFALPVRSPNRGMAAANLLRVGVQTTWLDNLWNALPGRAIWDEHLLLPLHSQLSLNQLEVVKELFG